MADERGPEQQPREDLADDSGLAETAKDRVHEARGANHHNQLQQDDE